MLVKDFDYFLPKELIAQYPLEKRDESRLLLLNRKSGEILETIFENIVNYLIPGDLLVLNQTKVIPARILGKLEDTNQEIEILLIKSIKKNTWEALSKPAKKLKVGSTIKFNGAFAKVVEYKETGLRIIEFFGKNAFEIMNEQGEIALPPYIKTKIPDLDRYQTVYAQTPGAIASPTAGLHFTEKLLEKIKAKGIFVEMITLHASLGTFRPILTEIVEEHKMYSEEFEISVQASQAINMAKKDKRRVIAVGTTVVRALESQANIQRDGVWQVKPAHTNTKLFIYPPYQFKIVDAIITNFHLPKSTLLLLVSAFATKEYIFKAYDYAIKNKFRFYSFGDAMFIY